MFRTGSIFLHVTFTTLFMALALMGVFPVMMGIAAAIQMLLLALALRLRR